MLFIGMHLCVASCHFRFSPRLFLNIREERKQVSCSYKTAGKNILLYIMTDLLKALIYGARKPLC
jgi:hypothetical protein